MKENIITVKRHQSFYEFKLRHFVSGIEKVKSLLLELHPIKDSILKKKSIEFLIGTLLLTLKGKYVMLESPPKNNKTIWNDKSLFTSQNILTMRFSQMLGVVLIGKEKVFKPFWNNVCLEESKKLWYPTKTDCVDLDLNSSSLSLKKTEYNSPFWMIEKENHLSKNSQKTSVPLYTSIPVENTERDGIRVRKLRIYPTPPQKKILKEWMRTTRWLWNKVLGRIREEDLEKNFFKLRNKFVIAKDNPEVSEWEKETPKDVRAGTVKELVTSYKSAFSNLRNGNINQFKIGFKSKKKCEYPTLTIPKSSITYKEKSLYIFKTYLKSKFKIGERKNKWLKEKPDCDCKLSFKNGKWFLIVPCKMKIKEEYKRDTVISLDPGKRSFMTGYSEENTFKVVPNFERIKQLQKKLNLFQSLKDLKEIRIKSWKYRRRKIYEKMNNLIDEMHYKTIRLLEGFEKILLPTFESQEMMCKSRNKNLNRNLLQLKHFLFQTRIKERCDTRVKMCTEEYTSKTCGRCGYINNIGSEEVFSCESCDFETDRDVNGARNIFLKFFYGS